MPPGGGFQIAPDLVRDTFVLPPHISDSHPRTRHKLHILVKMVDLLCFVVSFVNLQR